MANLLLEIGTEELPAEFVRLALPQLESLSRKDLREARLNHGPLRAMGTPRRLALLVEDLADHQSERTLERKGPPADQAYRDGQATAAAMGFARSCGVSPDLLEIRPTEKGSFVFARLLQESRSAAEILPELLPAWIWSLQGRRFMRWGAGDARFSRPLRWLVAMLDGEVLPVNLETCDPPLVSGRLSRGHRLQQQHVTIPAATGYVTTLASAGVQVVREDRAALIRQQLQEAAQRTGGDVDLPPELFEELVDLVEAPVLIEGTIENRFLALPPEVIRTVMRAHQRYVPLLVPSAPGDPLALQSDGVLLPGFLAIGNGSGEASETVRRGNERVLRARLADATFFLAADRAVASIDRRAALARVTFAEGLGSLLDRVERLEWLTDVLLESLPLPEGTAQQARRAAHLCKHDLVSQMVGEFPELQGVIGGKYLLMEGESREVSMAVQEHYLPRGASDALPSTDSGAVVALAERLELLLSIHAKGERPSGSSDPYGLRRAGNGILQILWKRDWSLNLMALLRRATLHWHSQFPHFQVDPAGLADELADFLRQRVVGLLEEEGADGDLVQAVAGEGLPLERLLGDAVDARHRVRLLATLRSTGELPGVQLVVQRAARLTANGSLGTAVISPVGVVKPELFSSPSEAAMLEVLQRLEPIATGHGTGRYIDLARGLAESSLTLGAFFDGDTSVMVMAEDPNVRANRLNLLTVLRNQASVLADFSRLGG